MLTEIQKRVIRENPHLRHADLSKLIGISDYAIRVHRKRRGFVSPITYCGYGVPPQEIIEKIGE